MMYCFHAEKLSFAANYFEVLFFPLQINANILARMTLNDNKAALAADVNYQSERRTYIIHKLQIHPCALYYLDTYINWNVV